MDAPQPATEKSSPLNLRSLWVIVPITTIGVWWDLYSKSSVFGQLGYPAGSGKIYHWLGKLSTFRLFTSFNEGALWGFGQGWTSLFAILSVVAVVAIFYALLRTPAGKSHWITAALCLVLSGTLGNLYDRLGLYGYKNPETNEPIRAVRDFLLFTFGTYSWPIFNFADVFLVTGTGMLVAYSFWSERQAARQLQSATQQLATTESQQCSLPTEIRAV